MNCQPKSWQSTENECWHCINASRVSRTRQQMALVLRQHSVPQLRRALQRSGCPLWGKWSLPRRKQEAHTTGPESWNKWKGSCALGGKGFPLPHHKKRRKQNGNDTFYCSSRLAGHHNDKGSGGTLMPCWGRLSPNRSLTSRAGHLKYLLLNTC